MSRKITRAFAQFDRLLFEAERTRMLLRHEFDRFPGIVRDATAAIDALEKVLDDAVLEIAIAAHDHADGPRREPGDTR